MKFAHLSDMVGGWLIGDFEPSVIRTKHFEVGVKRYMAGTVDSLHFHKIAQEVTVVISGRALMGGIDINEGHIVIVEPGETAQFKAITDVVLAVVKLPSARDDKYPFEEINCF